ncbi:antibiotic biosynthesis monooxygenase [Blastococcus mobilis]|uniref:Quinol monooxygenase YgiN n=1 Tax=Blastococcus mobilis TaxID=1938746 RepID=A0A238XBB0_9ACTN|nr:antibiotic biosynthesis monooxygenase [Blastococcus mobilis]SNR55980.1 Quinol monooxygenase YgiN [Blastococcus mobilis]
MYARSTTFSGEPDAIDDGIAYTRDEVLPTVQQMKGCIGLSMLVDRHTGRCVVTTSWEDADAMHDSAEAMRSIREAAIRTVHVLESETEVVEWVVGVLHRVREAPDRAACRVIRTKGPLGETDRIIDGFRANIVPRIDDLAGFCSVSLFVNRETGRCAITSVYEDRQTMNRAKGQAQAMREEFTGHMGMRITEVAEFDVALAHLRVPETV